MNREEIILDRVAKLKNPARMMHLISTLLSQNNMKRDERGRESHTKRRKTGR
jgi:hypothetical protein